MNISKHTERASNKAHVTVPYLRAMKRNGERISAVSVYDSTFARLFDKADIEILLVGDSVGMNVQGEKSTISVSVDDIIYHCRAVVNGAKRAHVVGDMPFISCKLSNEETLRNVGRVLSEGGAHSVKIEGGVNMGETISQVVNAGIPVMGHVGLMPQHLHALGGFRVQGKTDTMAKAILEDAMTVAHAGAYSLVLEAIPSDLAAQITAAVDIPTIGIGAGVHCDGQILVSNDLLGLTSGLYPKFIKQYANFFQDGIDVARRYRDEVRSSRFPTEEYSYSFGNACKADEIQS